MIAPRRSSARIRAGSSVPAERNALAAESERPAGPPVTSRGAQGTTALEGGTEQIAELNLRAGKYAVGCFLADRKGGKPHLAKGQFAEVTVR